MRSRRIWCCVVLESGDKCGLGSDGAVLIRNIATSHATFTCLQWLTYITHGLALLPSARSVGITFAATPFGKRVGTRRCRKDGVLNRAKADAQACTDPWGEDVPPPSQCVGATESTQVRLSRVNEQAVNVQCDPNMQAHVVKDVAHAHLGSMYNPNNIVLVNNGRELETFATLRENGVTSRAIVHVAIRYEWAISPDDFVNAGH